MQYIVLFGRIETSKTGDYLPMHTAILPVIIKRISILWWALGECWTIKEYQFLDLEWSSFNNAEFRHSIADSSRSQFVFYGIGVSVCFSVLLLEFGSNVCETQIRILCANRSKGRRKKVIYSIPLLLFKLSISYLD